MHTITIQWSDGKETRESFHNTDDFFLYIDSIKRDTGITAEDWQSDDPTFL